MKRTPVQLRADGIPRRNDISLHTPAEKAVSNAIQAVEALGADPELTRAVQSLLDVREVVADWVERDVNG